MKVVGKGKMSVHEETSFTAVFVVNWYRLRTVMMPFGVLGCSQLNSKALPCSLCSTVKLVRWAGEASRVRMSTHGLDTLPERFNFSQSTRLNANNYKENDVNS